MPAQFGPDQLLLLIGDAIRLNYFLITCIYYVANQQNCRVFKYYSYTFTKVETRQVVGVVATNCEDAWAQLGVKLGSAMYRSGFAQSGAPIYLGEHSPGAKLAPRDQQIGQQ